MDRVAMLQNTELFSRLRQEELDVIARYSEERRYGDGEPVFTAGSLANELFIIEQGTVVIRRPGADAIERDIARFIPGECFGELDLFERATRTATAIAENATGLLCFPMRMVSFEEILKKHPDVSARLLHKLIAIIAGRIRSVNRLISEKTPWVQELRKQLVTDKLTGLYNAVFMEEDVPGLLAEWQEPTALLAVKPDNFKELNDSFGHDTGDRALQLMAIFIHSALREQDLAIRYHGDEFVVLLPGTRRERAYGIAEDIRTAVSGIDLAGLTGGRSFQLTCSIGLSLYPTQAENDAELIADAYRNMHAVRSGGGDGIY